MSADDGLFACRGHHIDVAKADCKQSAAGGDIAAAYREWAGIIAVTAEIKQT